MSEFADRHVLINGESSCIGLVTAARPAVKRVLAGEDRTTPGLRTWSGEAR